MDSLPETAERAAEDGNVEATLNSPVKKVGAEQNGPIAVIRLVRFVLM